MTARLLTAMVTPFDDRLDVDLNRAAELARRLVETGCDGLVVAGSTGEGSTLEPDERLALFRAVVEAVADRAEVWAAVAASSTRDAARQVERASATGVHGVMVTCPSYNKPTQDGLVQHFQVVAGATNLPLMVYNIPGRTAVNLLPETFARLCRQVANVRAIKEASGSLDQAADVVRLAPEAILYTGDDGMLLPTLAVGGRGVVSVAAHVVGPAMAQLIDAFAAGRTAESARLHGRLLPVFRALFRLSNPILVKAALAARGFDAGGLRLPLLRAPESEVEVVLRALAEFDSWYSMN